MFTDDKELLKSIIKTVKRHLADALAFVGSMESLSNDAYYSSAQNLISPVVQEISLAEKNILEIKVLIDYIESDKGTTAGSIGGF